MGIKKDNKRKNIFITWHYTSYGIAYLKHILAAFYAGRVTLDKLEAFDIKQEEMNNKIFKSGAFTSGFKFDKVYYLIAPQKTFDKLSSRRFNYIDNILKDSLIKKSNSLEIWKELIEQRKQKLDNFQQPLDLKKEIEYVQNNYSNKYKQWLNQVWRDIQHYTIEDQILWLKTYSNIDEHYKKDEVFIKKELQVNDLHDHLEISEKLYSFINYVKKNHKKANFIINVSLGTNETQVVWHLFSELNILPENTQLINTYDDKTEYDKRFKNFNIIKVPKNIKSAISAQLKLFTSPPVSLKRKLAEQKFENYLKSGFAILLLGERGIGKTRLAKKYKEVISVNCASIAADDKAEAELYGYEPGTFTGALEGGKKGLFEEANGKILFFDEIHQLNLKNQAKLMTATSTNKKNEFTIRHIGGKEDIHVKATLIFATNRSLQELQNKLLPDFYDRIVQYVVEIPPLRESKDDIEKVFYNCWKELKFLNQPDPPIDSQLINWIKTLELKGNFRDLQRIAMYYNIFLIFDSEIKELIKEESVKNKNNIIINSALDFTKSEYYKYIETKDSKIELFSEHLNEKDLVNLYKRELADHFIKQYGSAAKAAEHFKDLGGKIDQRTLYEWKNKKLSFEKK